MGWGTSFGGATSTAGGGDWGATWGGSRAKGIGKPTNPVDAGWKKFGEQAKAAALAPLGAINDVLGAPERGVQGTVGSEGDLGNRLGHGVYAAFHPHDTATQERNLAGAERALGMGERSAGTDFGGKAENFARDTATQTLLDPLSYIPFIGGGRLVERALAGSAEALHRALPAPVQAGANAAGNRVRQFFASNPELDAALTKQGANVYTGIHASERGKSATQQAIDDHILKLAGPSLEKGITPTILQERGLAEGWLHGTQKMRDQAEDLAAKHGIDLEAAMKSGRVVDPAEYARLKDTPSRVLNYDLLEEYEPYFRQRKPHEGPEAAPFTTIKVKPSEATFEEHRLGEATPNESLADRWKRRLALARNIIFERSVDQRMIDELIKRNAAGNIPRIEQLRAAAEAEQDPAVRAEMHKTIDAIDKRGAGTLIKDPAALDRMRDQPKTYLKGIPELNKLTNLYRAALFTNPLPHMFNVARLTYLAGGPSAVARGLGHYFGGGVKGELGERLGETVGAPVYLAGADRTMVDKIPGARALREYGQGQLSAFDRAMRAGYLQELDDAAGDAGKIERFSPAEYEKGARVREDIGDYEGRPGYIKGLEEAIGAPFANWRLGIVPKAVGKATVRAPQRLERYARGIETANSQGGPQIEFGGPEEDFGRLAASLGTVPTMQGSRYIASPSTIGPVSALLPTPYAQPSATEIAEDLARSYIPGAGVAEEATGLSPYKEAPNRILNLLLSLVGGYTKAPPAKASAHSASWGAAW